MKNAVLVRLTEVFAKREPSITELTELRQQIHDRELEVRARLRDMETEKSPLALLTIDGEKLAALEFEARALYSELELLPARLHELDQRETAAQRRAAPAKAAAALKRFGPALEAAAAAKQAWGAAREVLNQTFAELGHQRVLAREGGFETKRMAEEDFERFVAVMDLIGALPRNALSSFEVKTRLQRVATMRGTMFDETWDDAYEKLLKPIGYEISPEHTERRIEQEWIP